MRASSMCSSAPAAAGERKRPEPRLSRRWLMAASFSLLLAGGAAPASAADVLIVRTSDLAPFQAVEKAFVAGVGRPTRTLNLADPAAAAELKAAAAGAPLVLAIGGGAAKAVAEAGAQVPTITTLVQAQQGQGPKVRAVPMFVAPARQAAAIKALLPAAKRVGILYDPAQSGKLVDACEAAASAAGLSLVRAEVRAKKDVAAAARTLMGKVDVLWLVADPTVIAVETVKFVLQTSLEMKVPVVAFSEALAKAGAVMAVEARYAEMGQKAAALARKLAAGEDPPVEAPDGTIFLNGKSAGQLGITLPAGLRAQAAKVYE